MRIVVAGVSGLLLFAGLCPAQDRTQAQGSPAGVVEASQDAVPPPSIRLAAGTEITLKMAQSLSSKHAVIGERVELTVAEDIVVNDWVVVPKGTRVLGTVKVGKKKEKAGNSHDLVLEIDYIAMGERHVTLGGREAANGKVNKGTVAASTVAFGVVGLLVSLNARTATIPEGTILAAFVDEDIDLPPLGRAKREEAVRKAASAGDRCRDRAPCRARAPGAPAAPRSPFPAAVAARPQPRRGP
jgi:hypothetical protein